MAARAGQLCWLLVVCGVVSAGVFAGLRDMAVALWVAAGLFAAVGLIIMIRPFRREDWEEFWERVGEWCVWW